MNNQCEKMKDKITDYVLEILDEDEIENLKEHVEQCSVCKGILESLQKEREIILQFGKNIDSKMNEHEESVIAALEKASSKKSINSMFFYSRVFRFAAAAAVIIVLFVGITNLNGTNAWAEVIKALNEVDQVHITEKMVMPNSDKVEVEWWFKKPNLYRQQSESSFVIDNGTDRLTINKEKKTIQFSDSWLPYQPITEHYMYEQVELLRKKNKRDIKLTKLPADSNDSVSVYAINDEEPYIVKVWVQTQTMLPLKMTAKRTGQLKPNEPNEDELIFNYNEINEAVFAMEIPTGYTELPRKLAGTVTGKVIDEKSKLVSGAVVHIVDYSGNYAETTQTDEKGDFSFKLKPDYVQPSGLWLPVMIRAYKQNDPNTLAWTIIKDPNARNNPPFNISGQIGYAEIKDKLLNNASGIILKMEPAAVISGIVRDIKGNPIPYAEISVSCHVADQYGNESDHSLVIRNLGGTGKYGLVEAKADKEGKYLVGNLPKFWDKTRWIISAGQKGYVTDGITYRSTGELESIELNFKLYHAIVTVTGTLKDNYNQPLVNRIIYARVEDKTFSKCYVITDKQGRFRLEGCPAVANLHVFAELSHDAPYYPNVTVDTGYKEGKTIFNVEMIAEKPEFVIEVTVKDSSGKILPYFPIEIRSDAADISSAWQAEKKLEQRTDKNGYCKFTEVPNVKGLKLVFWGENSVWKDTLSEEEKNKISNDYRKYKWTEIPIEINKSQKEYKVNVTILTNEESSKVKS
jgi:protocatechuate 3,4-dioxygenase beta subunit